MPYFENLAEYVEWLADSLGIYGGCTVDNPESEGKCLGCRICWADEMETRIKSAVRETEKTEKTEI